MDATSLDFESVVVVSSISIPESKDVDKESVWNEVFGVLYPVDGSVFVDVMETVLTVLNDLANSLPAVLLT